MSPTPTVFDPQVLSTLQAARKAFQTGATKSVPVNGQPTTIPYPFPSPTDWPYNYHGYATQDFLTIDGRFASDGTSATAVTELTELIEAAHARGLYVILDIVINHTAEVFDYYYHNQVVNSFSDPGILYDREVLVAANTSTTAAFTGFILMDIDINRSKPSMTVAYSNMGTTGTGTVQLITAANFYDGATITGSGDTAALFVRLAPMEVQVLTPL